jgi:hypothetical protein
MSSRLYDAILVAQEYIIELEKSIKFIENDNYDLQNIAELCKKEEEWRAIEIWFVSLNSDFPEGKYGYLTSEYKT